jgi:uncharacterized membrane protein
MYKSIKKNPLITTLKENFLNIPFGRKIFVISLMIGIIFLFFPWFYEGSKWYNSFVKIPIFGFIFISSLFFSLIIFLKETFWKKKMFSSINNTKLLMITISIVFYTLILYVFVLYYLLNYNPRADIGNGGMLFFVSLGVSFMGLYLSKDFIPTNTKERSKTII